MQPHNVHAHFLGLAAAARDRLGGEYVPNLDPKRKDGYPPVLPLPNTVFRPFIAWPTTELVNQALLQHKHGLAPLIPFSTLEPQQQPQTTQTQAASTTLKRAEPLGRRRRTSSSGGRSLDSSSEDSECEQQAGADARQHSSPRSAGTSSRASSMSESETGSPRKGSTHYRHDRRGGSSDQSTPFVHDPASLAALFALHSSTLPPVPLPLYGTFSHSEVPGRTPHATEKGTEETRGGPSSSFAFDASYEEEALHRRPVIDWEKEFRNEVGARREAQTSAIISRPANVRSCPDASSSHLRQRQVCRPRTDSAWTGEPAFPSHAQLRAAAPLRFAAGHSPSSPSGAPSESPSVEVVRDSNAPRQTRRRQRHEIPPEARVCAMCLTSKTGQWRADADGKPTLCNACGLRLRNKSKRKTLKFIDESSTVGQKRHRSTSGSDSGSSSADSFSSGRRGSANMGSSSSHSAYPRDLAEAERAAKMIGFSTESPATTTAQRAPIEQHRELREEVSQESDPSDSSSAEAREVVPRRSTIYSILN